MDEAVPHRQSFKIAPMSARSFRQSQDGNFAVVTALIAAVLVGAMGGALDLSQQWRDQSVVQRAADAAALAGAKELENGTPESAQRKIQEMAVANLPEHFPPVSFAGTIDLDGGTVEVTANGSVAPSFLPLFRIEDLSIGASATAAIQRKVYTDFYFMLDVSESMNIAATESDRSRLEELSTRIMKNRQDQACAFACHTELDTKDSYRPDGKRKEKESIYQLARNAGIQLRIDVLRNAASGMIDQILSLNSQPGSLKSSRIATYGFSEAFMVGSPASADAKALKDTLGPYFFPEANKHSDPRNALRKFASEIGRQGNGGSQATPRKFAILVTDGVRDLGFNRSQLSAYSPSFCDAIKAQNVELAILEVKYLYYPDIHGYFRDRVQNYYGQISPNLKNCASPGLHYLATDAGQAQGALLQLTEDLLSVRRRLVN